MAKVFLSHSSRQKHIVERVVNKLGRDRCIYDKFVFEAGMDTLDEILKGLEETDLFVCFISSEALDSAWVKVELKESKKLFYLSSIKQFLPIIVDDTSHSDPRIPDWLKKRNLRQLHEVFLIVKKIEQSVREIIIESNPLAKAKEEAFVGRNSSMEQFENEILTTNSLRPVSFIASGVEGVGRRTFMRKALAKTKMTSEFYEPVSILLDAKESVEDFIIKILELDGSLSDEILSAMNERNFQQKVDQAIDIMIKIIDNNEKLFILDAGCIIKPNKIIADWFLQITNDTRLHNTLSIMVISRFRPNPSFIVRNRKIKAIHIEPLTEKDREKLFVQYSEILQIKIGAENSKKILNCLNGIPSQVHYALDLVKASSIEYVINNLDEIVEYGDARIFYIIEEIQNNKQKLEILVLLAKVDFISFDLLYSVIGRSQQNEEILQEFFLMGIYDTFGGFSEHIRVNYTISDYIRRSKFNISQEYSAKLRNNIKEFLSEGKVNMDVSELLYNVKSALVSGVKIPERYYLPSFVLKSIVDMYYANKNAQVIEIADGILNNNLRMDFDMEREIRYWLCLSLAKEKLVRFEDEVKLFDGADYDFLLGFYYRKKRDFDRALTHLRKALTTSPNFNRAKRELVNVLLSKGQYTFALEIAKENYNRAKANAFHIQAYFICLIRKHGLNSSDVQMLEHLINTIRKTNDKKAEELYNAMRSEYEYYVKHNVIAAVKGLEESLKTSQYKYYPYKALWELYMREGNRSMADNLKEKYDKDNFSMEEVEIS